MKFEQIETLEKVQLGMEISSLHEVILYNDDVNTFDWVIQSTYGSL